MEQPVSLGLARYIAMQRHDQNEPALEEHIGLGADRIGLEAPRLDAIGGPARRVVIAEQMLRNQEAFPRLGIVGTLRILAELAQPVDRRLIGQVPLGELLQNPAVDLAPRRRHIGHDADRVA